MFERRSYIILLFFVTVTFIATGAVLLSGDPATQPKRFDYLVREDMFAGFRGDTAAMQRAIKLCEDTLRINPNHPEALVWHGSAIWYLSGKAFQNHDVQTGMALSDSGLSEMDRAVELDSNNIGVRIPRAAAILAAAPFIPDPYGKMLMQKGLADYLKTLQIQSAYFSKLPMHPKGELLGALADTYRQLGDTASARTYYTRITHELPGSEYARRSSNWLKLKDLNTKTITLKPVTCIGCHTEED